MENPKSTHQDDQFFDVSDEFPFYDCPVQLKSSDDSGHFRSTPAGSLRRRRLHERNWKFRDNYRSMSSDGVILEKNESSTVTTAEDNRNDLSLVRENNEGQFSLMVFFADFLVKAIGFQFHLLIGFVRFPFWVLYYCYKLALNPLLVVSHGKEYVIGKLLSLWNSFTPFLSEWKKEHEYLMKFGLRFGWGLFWSVLVGSVLVTLLILAFVLSGLVMRYYLVEEPFHLNQALNFDYTKSKPVAFMPITACRIMESAEYSDFRGSRGVRAVPSGYKLQTSVELVLPESDYNRNLGIFQIRVDFLSENGKPLGSVSHPCMLQFRSEPIRLLLTFFKAIPLIAGYVSESQTLKLKLREYTENVTPTACLRVTIEQRAEYRGEAGIPELYNAFLLIESSLPFLKRILWHWRRTVFVWLSMILFSVELLFALVCYGAVRIPRVSHEAQT